MRIMHRVELATASILFALTVNSFIYGEDTEVNEICKSGDVIYMKLYYPKPNYLGGPPSPAARPTRIPSTQEDYRTTLLRITATKNAKEDKSVRYILKLDTIDESGNLLVEGLYYAYAELSGTIWRLIQKDFDDGVDSECDIFRYDTPFPLTGMQPSSFNDKNEVFRTPSKGYKCFYIKPLQAYDNSLMNTIEVSVLKKPSGFSRSGEIDAIDDSLRSEIKSMRMVCRELQEWETTGWIWKHMKRYDDKGNFMLECTVYKTRQNMTDDIPKGTVIEKIKQTEADKRRLEKLFGKRRVTIDSENSDDGKE